MSPSLLLISWKPLPLFKHNGLGLYYVVYYERADGKGLQYRKEVKNGSSYIVNGTDYFVKYKIRIQAANFKGFGPKSPAVFGYSGEEGKETRSVHPIRHERFLKVRTLDFCSLLHTKRR